MFSNLHDYVSNLDGNNRDLRQDVLVESKGIKVSEPGKKIFNPDLDGLSFHRSTIILPTDATDLLRNTEYIIEPREYIYNIKNQSQRDKPILGEILRKDVQSENDRKRVLRDPTEMPQSDIRVDYNKLKLNNDTTPLPYMAGMNSEPYNFDERMQSKSPERDVNPIAKIAIQKQIRQEQEEQASNAKFKPGKKISYDHLDTSYAPGYEVEYIKKENVSKDDLRHHISEEELNATAQKDSFKDDKEYVEKHIPNKKDFKVDPRDDNDPNKLYNEFINSLDFDINNVLEPRTIEKESKRKMNDIKDTEKAFTVDVQTEPRIMYYPEGMVIHRDTEDIDTMNEKYVAVDYDKEAINKVSKKRDIVTLHKEGLDDERIEFFVSSDGTSNIRQTAYVKNNVLHVFKKPLKSVDEPTYMYEIPMVEIDRRFAKKYNIMKDDDRQLKLDFNDSKDLFEFTQNMHPTRMIMNESKKIVEDNPSREFLDYSVDMASLTEHKKIMNVKNQYKKDIKLDVESNDSIVGNDVGKINVMNIKNQYKKDIKLDVESNNGIVGNDQEGNKSYRIKQNSLKNGVDKKKLNKMWNNE